MGGLRFKTSLSKKLAKIPISTNKSGVVVNNCNLSYAGGTGRRITI
jgi:hypothetical protein